MFIDKYKSNTIMIIRIKRSFTQANSHLIILNNPKYLFETYRPISVKLLFSSNFEKYN